MELKLAIHERPGTFSDRWIEYCRANGIKYKTVNCYDTDIMEQLRGVHGLLFHWIFNDASAHRVARSVIASAEQAGIEVYPNTTTCWHYDDKIAQKYLLEAIGAPLVPTYIFYEKEKAMQWIDETEFPKVFKLSCGACSQNVRLVMTRAEARALCETAFSKGFNSLAGYFSDVRTKVRKTKGYRDFIAKLRRMPGAIKERAFKNRMLSKQNGYIYFQDFLDGNHYDTRITVIGDRAFGFTRNTRPNDFRASGSGEISFDLARVDVRCVDAAFDVVKRLGAQSLATDFIFDHDSNPKLTEISYCFGNKDTQSVYNCKGYWDDEHRWHSGHFQPEHLILSDLLTEIENKLTHSVTV